MLSKYSSLIVTILSNRKSNPKVWLLLYAELEFFSVDTYNVRLVDTSVELVTCMVTTYNVKQNFHNDQNMIKIYNEILSKFPSTK